MMMMLRRLPPARMPRRFKASTVAPAAAALFQQQQHLIPSMSRHVEDSSSSSSSSPLKKPDLACAEAMPREYYEFPNELLLLMSAHGDHEARRERLVREIMHKDQLSWEQAQPKVDQIAAATHKGIRLATAPFRIAIYTSLFAGLASFPLVFHLDTALWFNEHFVTAEVASGEDLETLLEVGSWTWNWMEPPLGQISFFILCLQLARDQGANIGKKSFSEILKNRRANAVACNFPKYNRKIVEDFAETEFNNKA